MIIIYIKEGLETYIYTIRLFFYKFTVKFFVKNLDQGTWLCQTQFENKRNKLILDHYQPCWTILYHLGTIKTRLGYFAPFWTILDYLGPFMTILEHFGTCLTL